MHIDIYINLGAIKLVAESFDTVLNSRIYTFSPLTSKSKMASPPPTNPKAFVFDIFGTVVNWRESLAKGLSEAANSAVEAAQGSDKVPEAVVARVRDMVFTDWQWFASEW